MFDMDQKIDHDKTNVYYIYGLSIYGAVIEHRAAVL